VPDGEDEGEEGMKLTAKRVWARMKNLCELRCFDACDYGKPLKMPYCDFTSCPLLKARYADMGKWK